MNKVILVGQLGRDPETRRMPSGHAVRHIRVATKEEWKDTQSGLTKQRTEWHNVVLFDQLGEFAAEQLHKGSSVYIEGSLRTRNWKDKDGKVRYSTEIVANELQVPTENRADAEVTIRRPLNRVEYNLALSRLQLPF